MRGAFLYLLMCTVFAMWMNSRFSSKEGAEKCVQVHMFKKLCEKDKKRLTPYPSSRENKDGVDANATILSNESKLGLGRTTSSFCFSV